MTQGIGVAQDTKKVKLIYDNNILPTKDKEWTRW